MAWIVALLLCCLRCTLPALAAPATLDTSVSSLDAFGTSPLGSDVPAGLRPPSPLPPTASAVLNATTPNPMIPYRVPNTPTRLNFVLYHGPIEKADMGRTILRTQQALRAQIASIYQLRDLPLQPDDEPYKSDPIWAGCFIGVIAYPPPKAPRFVIEYHLTYGMVENVLQGLWEFLYRGNRFVEVAFEVLDDQWGLVGLGKVSSVRPGSGGGDEA